MSKPLSSCAPLNPHADLVAWDSDQGTQLYPIGERYFVYVGHELRGICPSHVALQNLLKRFIEYEKVNPDLIVMVPQQCYAPQPKS